VLALLISDLAAGRHLSGDQVQSAVDQLIDPDIAAEIKADFLCHLALKGETHGEIASFAAALREKSIQPPLDPQTRGRAILDVVGTGGDRMNTFNISTTVAIVCAAAGIPVAKHGNRAITSQVGSADVLEALGIRIDLPPAEAAQSLRDLGFAFFFAPNYHPAFKYIGAARRLCADRGQRTIFNFLGPLLNPARPDCLLVGVPRPDLCEPLARVLQALGVRRAMVVSGEVDCSSAGRVSSSPEPKPHLDELSTLGDSTIAEFYQERGLACSRLARETFSLQPATLEDLRGADRDTNARIIRKLLAGEERGPRRDAVLLNAAAAMLVADAAKSLLDGWRLAAEVIDSGQAAKKLNALAAHS
jgi:anthranilate phosphoribosyltransferase